MISELIQQQISERKHKGLYRQRVIVTSTDYPLDFSSNDYLSLRRDARVKRAYQQGFARYDSGSGGSMLVSGYQPIHQELEQELARQLQTDKALLFSSGYAANLAIVTTLARLGCHFIVDKAVHASIYDGLSLAKAGFCRYLHNDHEDLQKKLSQGTPASLLITEGIFSMSGQQPDLAELGRLCASHGLPFVVDEAHAFGVIGPGGMGAVAHYGLSQTQVPLRMIAFGKALGGQGAAVVGQADWVDALYQNARSCIYSTAISPAMSHGLLESLYLLIQADEARQKLAGLVAYFQGAVSLRALPFRPSNSPIQQLRLGCPHKAQNLSNKLGKQGILCQAIRVPTLSRVDTGLRVVLNSHHQVEDIDRLLDETARLLPL
ncbi:aminotransferase class I/II-fold pyridoxal phosphate-dependent enzyme [Legionella sp. CNM-4043-24]|uniref:aminotransferase class I/II-fold pyridoxal phosphate-dependent enzyme n=1 Tax=Legionella sp. CNM-4043-24 TaxID=3421646 RepID=UPI00403AB476